jgi:hypothetical protein
VWRCSFLRHARGSQTLYIASEDGSIHDLHASAKLGERELQGGKWPGDWRNWWNNRGWVANVSQVESFEKRAFVLANVREYQIERFALRRPRVALDAGNVTGVTRR